jgi:hypothetical protein
MSPKELKKRVTDGGRWCPLCEQEIQRVSIIAPWIGPDGKLVCGYAVCEPCTQTMMDAPKSLQVDLINRVEQHLLAKYPRLWDRLPKGYLLCTDGGLT